MCPVRLIVLSVIALVLVGGGYWLYKRNTDPRIAGIPPHENADGTIDYTLVDWPPPELQKTPIFWVLRLPKELGVYQSDGKPSRIIYEGREFTFRSRKNDFLLFNLALPDLKPLPRDSGVSDKDKVQFSTGSSSHVSAKMWAEREKRDINDQCRLVGEFAPGVFEYDGEGNGSFCSHRYPSKHYALRDGAGKLLAYVSCYANNETCHAQTWLFERRRVGISFNVRHLAKLPEIHAGLVSILQKANVRVDPIPEFFVNCCER